MSTLHLNRQVSEPTTVVLEDWYEELADESLDPANILEQEEEEAELLDLEVNVNQSLSSTEEANMTATTLNTDKSFSLDKWLATAKTITNNEAEKAIVIPTPAWLTLKSGRCTPDNAFTVTAGVVKATRQVLDALSYTERQLEEKVEELHMQERRDMRHTVSKDWTFGPAMTALGVQLAEAQVANNDHPGFNPDGMEHVFHMDEIAKECDKLEAVIENGKRILSEILAWIAEHAEALQLRVQCGHEVHIGIIGNEIRTAKYLPLDQNTLLLAIEEQRAFIRSNRK